MQIKWFWLVSLLTLAVACGEGQNNVGETADEVTPEVTIVTSGIGKKAVVQVVPNTRMDIRVSIIGAKVGDEERSLATEERAQFEYEPLLPGEYGVAVWFVAIPSGTEGMKSATVTILPDGPAQPSPCPGGICQPPKFVSVLLATGSYGAYFRVQTDREVRLECQLREGYSAPSWGWSSGDGYSRGVVQKNNYCFAEGRQSGSYYNFRLVAKDEQTGAESFYLSTVTTQKASDPNDTTAPAVEVVHANTHGVVILSNEELSMVSENAFLGRGYPIKTWTLWYRGRDANGYSYVLDNPFNLFDPLPIGEVIIKVKDLSGNEAPPISAEIK